MTTSLPSPIRAVCVYASSSNHVASAYFDAAVALGQRMAQRGLTLVYGGGKVGLMGALARSVHQHHGRVVGIIPTYLRTVELVYEEADELVVTPGLREREAAMEERADAFIALPGGFGTLEEILEVLTLKQLRQHAKPVVFLSVDDYWRPVLEMFERFYAQRFAKPQNRELYRIAARPDEALDCLAAHVPTPLTAQWP